MRRPTFTPQRIFLLIVTFLTLLTLIGPLPAAQAAASLPTARINIGSVPDTIDPQIGSFSHEIVHMRMVFEGLTRLDENLQPVPAAAESWVFSQDGRQITFFLRSGLVYSDGTLLNAKRFEYAFKRTIDPYTAGQYAAMFDMITGAWAYRNADLSTITPQQLTALRNAVEVHARDITGAPCTDYNQITCRYLQIKFDAPQPAFLNIAALWLGWPAKEEKIVAGGETWWTNPLNFIGNGPYIMTSFNVLGHSTYIPNPNYWRGVAKVNVEFYYVSDSAAALDAYQQNALDVISATAADLPTIKADGMLSRQLITYPGSCTFGIMFNVDKEPFNDPKMRQAFSYAFNRQAFVDQVMGGGGVPTLTWIPPSVPGHNPNETRWGYNSVQADLALSQSIYQTAANVPLVTLTFTDSPRNRTRWEWLASQWQIELGISAKLNPVTGTVYNDLMSDPATKPQLFLLGWCSDYPDPQNWLSTYWHSSSMFAQRTGFNNPEFDSLVEQADTEMNPITRMALYSQAQDKLIDELPSAFAWNNINYLLVKPNLISGKPTSQDMYWPGETDPFNLNFKTIVSTDWIYLPSLSR